MFLMVCLQTLSSRFAFDVSLAAGSGFFGASAGSAPKPSTSVEKVDPFLDPFAMGSPGSSGNLGNAAAFQNPGEDPFAALAVTPSLAAPAPVASAPGNDFLHDFFSKAASPKKDGQVGEGSSSSDSDSDSGSSSDSDSEREERSTTIAGIFQSFICLLFQVAKFGIFPPRIAPSSS